MTFVRSAYAFGLRMAPDQAVHMTRTKDTSLVAQTKRIEHLYQKHRIALAFSEYLHAETLKFPTEVVEARSRLTRPDLGAAMNVENEYILAGCWSSKGVKANNGVVSHSLSK